MRIGSLFSGIGGLELGLEWAGVGHTVWQVERDRYCTQVLAQHWPDATRYDDVYTVGAHNLAPVDVICGGFPCPPFSSANTRTRTDRSGKDLHLWGEFARVITELSPRAVVVENVESGWRMWLPHVRRDLRRIGYTAVPLLLRASDVGAPFYGARVFVIATADRYGQPASPCHEEAPSVPSPTGYARSGWGAPSPAALGVADGVPRRMDRLRAIGNAVVPQCAYVVGRHLLSIDGVLA